jgi:hypothetical protein
MSACISNELDDLAKSFKLYWLEGELNYYQKVDSGLHSDKIELLTKTISGLVGAREQKDTGKSKIQSTFNEIDKMVYMKLWRKLPDFHKNVKIREYLDSNFKDKEGREVVENLLTSAIQNKELNRDEYVQYDQSQCKIFDIPVLKNIGGQFKLVLPAKARRGKPKKVSAKV